MKPLLNTTLLALLLVIGFSGGVSGQDAPDFEETKQRAEREIPYGHAAESE